MVDIPWTGWSPCGGSVEAASIPSTTITVEVSTESDTDPSFENKCTSTGFGSVTLTRQTYDPYNPTPDNGNYILVTGCCDICKINGFGYTSTGDDSLEHFGVLTTTFTFGDGSDPIVLNGYFFNTPFPVIFSMGFRNDPDDGCQFQIGITLGLSVDVCAGPDSLTGTTDWMDIGDFIGSFSFTFDSSGGFPSYDNEITITIA